MLKIPSSIYGKMPLLETKGGYSNGTNIQHIQFIDYILEKDAFGLSDHGKLKLKEKRDGLVETISCRNMTDVLVSKLPLRTKIELFLDNYQTSQKIRKRIVNHDYFHAFLKIKKYIESLAGKTNQ